MRATEWQREDWMAVLAQAPAARLEAAWTGFAGAAGALPDFRWLRPPETGTVMVRGRVAGTGEPFNLGEMTVTRCAVRLEDETAGHATVPGRDRRHAERAALADAMMQREATAALVVAHLLEPLSAAAAQERALRAEKAAATKVDFFTMTRGENA
ncbi:MAG: phosphonate C-P lyase system protein PhnG [Pseudomonadota bacterium]